MSYTKEEIYNLALSALLLSEEVTEISTSKSNNIKILNRFYPIALKATLQDLDLDGLSETVTLELIEELPTDHKWRYAYKYPTNCALFRRIDTERLTDTKSTFINKKTGIYNGQKVIYTNEYQATIEYIPKDVPLEYMDAMAGLALAYKLAELSAPLLVGKGAKKLREEIRALYVTYKLDAQETDMTENMVMEPDWQRSEYVEERLS